MTIQIFILMAIISFLGLLLGSKIKFDVEEYVFCAIASLFASVILVFESSDSIIFTNLFVKSLFFTLFAILTLYHIAKSISLNKYNKENEGFEDGN
jgi:multisubunit Na+/H+ antiporter MnhG subunit